MTKLTQLRHALEGVEVQNSDFYRYVICGRGRSLIDNWFLKKTLKSAAEFHRLFCSHEKNSTSPQKQQKLHLAHSKLQTAN